MYRPSLADRAKEINTFLGCDNAEERLRRGFHANHALVAEDFRAFAPANDDELLQWYRGTDAYIWELSVYHLEETGFNYSGMCDGIAARFVQKEFVLALGDGVGDLTIALHDVGANAYYHDLETSRTAEFARFRHSARYGQNGPAALWTAGWKPDVGDDCWDGIIALDFMEHLVNVEDWVRAAHTGLVTGGRLMAQNAFAIGDLEHEGSIPMHLVRNNHYEHDWATLLQDVGFDHEVAEWWIKR